MSPSRPRWTPPTTRSACSPSPLLTRGSAGACGVAQAITMRQHGLVALIGARYAQGAWSGAERCRLLRSLPRVSSRKVAGESRPGGAEIYLSPRTRPHEMMRCPLPKRGLVSTGTSWGERSGAPARERFPTFPHRGVPGGTVGTTTGRPEGPEPCANAGRRARRETG
jgi:hypothetical protein